MENILELIKEVGKINPTLASQLSNYVKNHSYGLSFEHTPPDNLRLWSKKVVIGDKVNILPSRGKFDKSDNFDIWNVKNIINDIVVIEKDGQICKKSINDVVSVVSPDDSIYPGLKVIEKVERGDKDVPYHMLINAENYHALQMLRYAYARKVDCIYIDPPYNTGNKDWKYNNNYVGEDDKYRHSKWLAMMERRLKLAKDLLNPDNSVMIVTIDEKEYLRLGMLLEQMFPEARIQMISSVINRHGTNRSDEFSRVNEYIYFVRFGISSIGKIDVTQTTGVGSEIRWISLRRTNKSNVRQVTNTQFYPIYVDANTSTIFKIGEPIPLDVAVSDIESIDGCVTVLPIRDDGTEMMWGVVPDELRKRLKNGYVHVGSYTPNKHQKYVINYLSSGEIANIESGIVEVRGHYSDGAVKAFYPNGKLVIPSNQWDRLSHEAQSYGTGILREIFSDRVFPFPKSLYAVEDCLRLFVSNKPNALIVDFFSGSGTTAHATMLLNHLDGGHRRCISITNNEIGSDNEKAFIKQGLRPTDKEWQSKGIANYITWPRIKAAITGIATNGEPIEGNYKFTEEFPMAEGFKENAIFCELTYEDYNDIQFDRVFDSIAPILWMASGCKDKIIEKVSKGYATTDRYAVLFKYEALNNFVKALKKKSSIQHIFVVTDDIQRFNSVLQKVNWIDKSNIHRLYDRYLDNFEFRIKAEGSLK